MARMEIKIVELGDKVAIELHQDGAQLGHIFQDGIDLEHLIEGLSKARANLPDAQGYVAPMDPHSRIRLVESNPAWQVPKDHNGPHGTALLALHHRGLGWIGYLLDGGRAFQISDALKKYVKD